MQKIKKQKQKQNKNKTNKNKTKKRKKNDFELINCINRYLVFKEPNFASASS